MIWNSLFNYIVMAKADKAFFINFHKELKGEKIQDSPIELIVAPHLYSADSIPSGCLIHAPNSQVLEEMKTVKDEAYDELCQQNIELSNEVAALKKENLELQNKLDASQSTNQGKSDNVVSLGAFIRFIDESFDEEEVKTIRNLGRAFFDGDAKDRINKAANKRLKDIKLPSTINNNFNKPVGTMVAYTDEITLKHE